METQPTHFDVAIQKQTLLCNTGTSMSKPQKVDHGVQHMYTCWPKDMADQTSLVKWIKRTERNDAYLHSVLSAGQKAETMILENVCLDQ